MSLTWSETCTDYSDSSEGHAPALEQDRHEEHAFAHFQQHAMPQVQQRGCQLP